MTPLDALKDVHKRIRAEMNDLADLLAQGGVQDFPEYRKVCGLIEGLARAERYLLDLADKLKEQDDS